MRKTLAKRYLLITHPEELRVALCHGPDGWTLPSVTLDNHFHAMIPPLFAAVRAEFGLDLTFLRSLFRHAEPHSDIADRVIAAELRSAADAGQLPEGWHWIGSGAIADLPLALPEHRQVINDWVSELRDGPPPHRAPWEHPGWLAGAVEWIDGCLSELGRSRTAPVEQVKIWNVSYLIKVPITGGAAYFKAVPTVFPAEMPITRTLSRLYPDLLPAPLAFDEARQWILMPEFPGHLLDLEPDPARWDAAMKAYARIQIDLLGRLGFLRESGCGDRRFPVLMEQYEQIVADRENLLGVGRMTPEQVDAVVALGPELRAAAARLEALGIPYSLEHGDLHARNIAVDGDRLTIFDWSDACIAHPFLTPWYFIDMLEESAVEKVEGIQQRLLDAYLEPWVALYPRELLAEAIDLAASLAPLHFAMSYYIYIMPATKDEAWGAMPGHFLKKLLAHWERRENRG